MKITIVSMWKCATKSTVAMIALAGGGKPLGNPEGTVVGARPFGIDRSLTNLQEMCAVSTSLALRQAEKADILHDWPCFMEYQALSTAYPDMKFVLVTRDADKWFESLMNYQHLGIRHWPLVYNKYLVGESILCKTNRNLAIEVYRQHVKDVISYFADKPGRLLVTGGPFKDVPAAVVLEFCETPNPVIRWPYLNQSSQTPLPALPDT